MTTWLEGIKKISLNTEPYIETGFNPNDSGFTNHIVFVRDSGVTESSTGSPTGYIYLNGIKYGDGLDTYINKVTYLNKDDSEHPYSLEFNYINGNKETFYVNIGDLGDVYSIVSGLVDAYEVMSGDIADLQERTDILEGDVEYLSGVTYSSYTEVKNDIVNIYNTLDNTIMSASYLPYSSTTSGSILALYMVNGDVNYININDIDYIIENYQPIVDDGLLTESNTISGAINEIYNIALDNQEDIYYLYQSLSGMSGCCEDIDGLKKQVSSLTQQVSDLTKVLDKAYINAYYENFDLNLIRVNGEVTTMRIAGGGGSGHCHCCCPIVEIMKDGDSWIQKLGKRVTALENYIYNQSGDILNIVYCVDDLEKRVHTLENEVDLDNDMIVDYTTVPVSAWSLNERSIRPVVNSYEKGFPFVTVTTDDGTANPFPYLTLSMTYDGFTTIALFSDDDGEVSLSDFNITGKNFLIARITKTNGKVVSLSNFNSLQSYFEDFTHLIKDATVTLKDGTLVYFDNVDKVFNRSKYVTEELERIKVNADTFSSLNVISPSVVVTIDDFDGAIAYIVSHTEDIYSGKVQLAFNLNSRNQPIIDEPSNSEPEDNFDYNIDDDEENFDYGMDCDCDNNCNCGHC